MAGVILIIFGVFGVPVFFAWHWANEHTVEALKQKPGTPAYDGHCQFWETGTAGQRYRQVLRTVLERLARLIELDAKTNEGVWTRTWSLAAYGLCLGIAVFYPLAFLIVGWVVTGHGEIGNIRLFEESTSLQPRFMILAWLICMLLVGIRLGRAQTLHSRLFWLVVHIGMFATTLFLVDSVAIAVAFAFTFTVAFAFAFTGAVAFALVGAGASAGAFTFTGTGGFSGISAFAGGVSGAVIFALVVENLRGRIGALAALLLAVFFAALPLTALYFNENPKCSGIYTLNNYGSWDCLILETKVELDDFGILLFLSLLPAANALWDWVSLGVTRYLLIQSAKGASWERTIIYGFLDMLLAFFFFFVMTLTIVGTMSLAQRIDPDVANLDMTNVISALRDKNDDSYNWIYWMVATTLIPTVIHFIIALPAIFLGMFSAVRGRMVELIHQAPENPNKALIAGKIAGGVYAVSTLIVMSILYGLWQFTTNHMSLVLGPVLDMAEALHTTIQAWN